jgi:uncharacterized membrane protein
MWRLWNTFFKGTAENFLGNGLRLLLPDHLYRPGMGLVVGFLVVLAAGTVVNAYIVKRAIRWGEMWLARIPLVKTIFGALKDLARFFPAGGERRDLQRVVLWRFANARLIGFVTAENVNERLFSSSSAKTVAVYFPMSYTIGGYTLYLPRDELEPSDLTVEEGLRLALIAGITSDQPR